MGPSGCGKSTLVKLLTGRLMPAKTVSVALGTKTHVLLSNTKYRRLLGYVPQEDVLHANLTVRENIEYAARLTMRPGARSLLRNALVWALVKELRLLDAQHKVVGSESRPGTSGGERKRVNIGMGMVSLTPVLILDEPTSGLDASTSCVVVDIMSALAQHAGLNVVCVLHTPRQDSFLRVDNVVLLARDGVVVYAGSPRGCRPYFEGRLGFSVDASNNIADSIMDITTGSNLPANRGGAGRRKRSGDEEQPADGGGSGSGGREDLGLQGLGADDLPFAWLLQSYHLDRQRFKEMQKELRSLAGDHPDSWTEMAAEVSKDRALEIYLIWAAPPAPAPAAASSPKQDETFPEVYNAYLERRLNNFVWLFVRNLHNSSRQFWVAQLDVSLLLAAALIVGAVQSHECELGVSATSTFAACLLSDLGWVFLSPAIYYAVYHFMVVPRASFGWYYLVGVLVCWWSSGFAYTISLSGIPPQAQLLFSIVLILIIGAFLHGLRPLSIRATRGTVLEAFLGFSYNRWAMEAATIQEFNRYMYERRVEIASAYYDLGICHMDRRMKDDGTVYDDDSGSLGPVLVAVAAGHVPVVRVLLKHANKAVVREAHGPLGMTALYWACKCGQKEVARLLLKHGAHVRTAAGIGELVISPAEKAPIRFITYLRG
ncbi:hypothetical protein GPECTOR_93g627 [Gonium pectorale]|uniref:ABC transporter domain-containing protein n=1 Tax=Gonium pectorale TaxID=33097 RepID=A0A150G0K0_GONPE|nr:hypothetical protein GPECTOR_93g627 [Gonium pectorale]|eukprot:KXZ43357.1 hypothetical protein GPECTOR_93g627 [Gonium pectorale]